MIGHLCNELVYIYRASEAEDNSGSIVTTYTLDHSEYTRVQPVSAREIIRSGYGVSSDIVYNFYLDVDTNILGTDRIKWNSDTYEIIEVRVYPSTYRLAVGRVVH